MKRENESPSSTDLTIKLVVLMDEDAHFRVAPWYDRKRVIEALRSSPDEWENAMWDSGDYSEQKNVTDEEIMEYNEEDFEDFVHRFTHRGRCEIVNLKL